MTSVLASILVTLSTLLWALAFGTRSWFAAAVALVLSIAAVAYISVSTRPGRIQAPPSAPAIPVPAPREALPPKTRRLVQPKTLDPRAVARAFFDNAFSVSQPVAAHIWLEDTETGTLRLVAGAGPLAPTNQPLPADQDTLGRSLAGGTAILEPHARLSSADREDTLWRYAVPIGYDSLRGVAALDFASTSPPDSAALNDIVAGFRPTLSGAIALYVADIRGHAARALLDAARALSRNLDPDQVVETALDTAMTSTRAATGSIMLLDATAGHLKIVAARGLPEEVVSTTEVAVGEGIAGWVAASNQPLLVEDLPGKKGRTDRHGVRSAVSVPIADEDGLLGVLNVGSRDFPARFTRAHLDILETLGRLTAVTLRNARAMSSAGDLYFDTLKA
ncbi:MAG: GAF domain-containing protein, partial [Coriobacteriia bacterium]|nr:GAF domain-containing protein [Coriobacteriia bacterium]